MSPLSYAGVSGLLSILVIACAGSAPAATSTSVPEAASPVAQVSIQEKLAALEASIDEAVEQFGSDVATNAVRMFQHTVWVLTDKDDIEGINVRQSRDGKFQFLPESYNYGMQDLLFYDEYWYRDYREQELLVDSKTGETMEWTGNEESLKEYLKSYGNRITKVTQTVPTVKLATVLEGHVLYHGPNFIQFGL